MDGGRFGMRDAAQCTSDSEVQLPNHPDVPIDADGHSNSVNVKFAEKELRAQLAALSDKMDRLSLQLTSAIDCMSSHGNCCNGSLRVTRLSTDRSTCRGRGSRHSERGHDARVGPAPPPRFRPSKPANDDKELPMLGCSSMKSTRSNKIEVIKEAFHQSGSMRCSRTGMGVASALMRAQSTSSKMEANNTMTGMSSVTSGGGGGGTFEAVQKEMLHMAMKTRKRHWLSEKVWEVLEDRESGRAAWLYHHLMPVFTVVSTVFSLMQTVDEHDRPIGRLESAVVETAIECCFVVDLILRHFVCPNRWAFFLSPYNLCDIISLVPLALRLSIGFVVTREIEETALGAVFLCAVPVLRLLKTLRFFPYVILLFRAFKLAFDTLPALLYIVALIALLFSSLIYLLEDRDNIPTVSTAIWLTIVTMTTVGYGDTVPVTPAGTVVVAVLVVSSVLYMAIPLGLIGHSFNRVWNDRHKILLVQRARDCLVQWGYTADSVQNFFRHIDTDGSGELDLVEFHEMIREMHLGLNDENINRLFLSFNTEGGNTISEQDFIRALFPGSYHKIYGIDSLEAQRLAEQSAHEADQDLLITEEDVLTERNSHSSKSPRPTPRPTTAGEKSPRPTTVGEKAPRPATGGLSPRPVTSSALSMISKNSYDDLEDGQNKRQLSKSKEVGSYDGHPWVQVTTPPTPTRAFVDRRRASEEMEVQQLDSEDSGVSNQYGAMTDSQPRLEDV